jgi:hypothetical protein
MAEPINIAGLDKAAVLCALFNACAPGGALAFLAAVAAPQDMTMEEARELLAQSPRFDYVRGRPLKVSLDGDLLDPRLYDRDQGQGAAARALAGLLVVAKEVRS